MADTSPQTSAPAVVDRRPIPRGVLPHRMQTWIMASIAAGMLLIMFIVGRPAPVPRSPAVSPSAMAPSADQLRAYQDRLRLLQVRAAQEAQAAATSSADVPTTASAGETTGATPPDPTLDDRKRRAYESLFASNVVLSRRPADQQPLGNGASRVMTASPPRDIPASPPNLQEVANAVVQATRYANGSAGVVSMPIAADGTHAPSAPAGASAPNSGTDALTADGSKYRLLEGTLIETVLTNRLDGSTASPVNCLVTTPVYTRAGQHVLIPAGARVLGETKPVQTVGEQRLAVAFHRLVFPDGRTISLDHFTGLNPRGDAALYDQVNQHYWSTFGAAAAVGLVSGLGQYLGTAGFGGTGDGTIVVAGGFGNATGEATAQVMNRFLNRLPTITIREGHRVKVYLTSDLDLPAYDAGPTAGSGAASR